MPFALRRISCCISPTLQTQRDLHADRLACDGRQAERAGAGVGVNSTLTTLLAAAPLAVTPPRHAAKAVIRGQFAGRASGRLQIAQAL